MGYASAGARTVSRPGVRRRKNHAALATNSLVPTQAASCAGSSDTEKRRRTQPAAAARRAALPIDAGYPRSAPDVARASITAAGGASHGVPTDRSTAPPGCAAAACAAEANRS